MESADDLWRTKGGIVGNEIRIAMWSGPRNISTAMMRSWASRSDCFVCDEPLYAHYLQETGLPHPGADETKRCHETDWRRVVSWLTGPIPEGASVFYQKQMAHHLVDEIKRDWLDRVTNCFLIREPAEMLTSLIEFIPEPTKFDTGLPQQVEILERVATKMGEIPPVLEARDVLENPAGMLTALCRRVGLEFCDQMLSWEVGPHASDGVWAKHWYAKVEKTTQFGAYRKKSVEVPKTLLPVLKECESLYEQLYDQRLTID